MRPAHIPLMTLALLFPLTTVQAGPLDRLIPGMKKDAESARKLAEKEIAKLQKCQETMQAQKKTAADTATTTVILRECQDLIEDGEDEYKRKDYSDAQEIFDRARDQAGKALEDCENATAFPKAKTPESEKPDVNIEAPTTATPAEQQTSAAIDVPGGDVPVAEDEEEEEEEDKDDEKSGEKDDEKSDKDETSADAEKTTTSTAEVTSGTTATEDAIKLPDPADKKKASADEDDEDDKDSGDRKARREKRRKAAERRKAREEAAAKRKAAKEDEEDDDEAASTLTEEPKDDKAAADSDKDDEKAADKEDTEGETETSSTPSKVTLRDRADSLNTRIDSLLHQVRAARSQARRARDEVDIDPKGAAASLDLAEQILKDIKGLQD